MPEGPLPLRGRWLGYGVGGLAGLLCGTAAMLVASPAVSIFDVQIGIGGARLTIPPNWVFAGGFCIGYSPLFLFGCLALLVAWRRRTWPWAAACALGALVPSVWAFIQITR